jgi:hypothetical protein
MHGYPTRKPLHKFGYPASDGTYLSGDSTHEPWHVPDREDAVQAERGAAAVAAAKRDDNQVAGGVGAVEKPSCSAAAGVAAVQAASAPQADVPGVCLSDSCCSSLCRRCRSMLRHALLPASQALPIKSLPINSSYCPSCLMLCTCS